MKKPTSKKTITKKPPVQKVGVPGFESFQSKKKGEEEHGINWQKLMSLPAYRIFISETCDKKATFPQQNDKWAFDNTKKQVEKHGEEAFYATYCEWHEKKGYWPNETPMGELVGE